jgi:hypothetical protein
MSLSGEVTTSAQVRAPGAEGVWYRANVNNCERFPNYLLLSPSFFFSFAAALATKTVIFDDDYPGEDAPRIDWLKFSKISLEAEDADEAATLMALYIRFALRSARKELWTLIVQTHPLLTVTSTTRDSPSRVSLGRMLRRLANGGSAVPPPAHRLNNSVEALLNFVNGDAAYSTDISDVGVSFFWTAVEESADEVSQAVGKFPQVCDAGDNYSDMVRRRFDFHRLTSLFLSLTFL